MTIMICGSMTFAREMADAKRKLEGYGHSVSVPKDIKSHILNKKVFLLNPLPSVKKARWVHEVAIMQPIIISGDLRKIKRYVKYRAT